MVKVSRIDIYEKLDKVIIPGANVSLVKYKGIRGLEIDEDGNVDIKVEVPKQAENNLKELEESVVKAIKSVENVKEVKVNISVNEKPYGTVEFKNLIPNVKFPILIGSGKGGVGKSTVSSNLAIAMAKLGHKVGLLDADFYGPSIAMMFGIKEEPVVNEKEKLVPFEKFGVKVMSLGFLLEEDTPVIWRGPLLMKALTQFLEDVEWGELDYLLIDLPPGTGDIQLSLAQNVKVKGAIAVTTPQDVALLDVKKAVTMFEKLNIPVMGVIENMSYFICHNCGTKHFIFSGNEMDTGDKLGLPVLGRIPIDSAIREGGDKGLPIVVGYPESPVTKEFLETAKIIAEKSGL
ncbi:ATP-binding protein involved in chromosome partitioning [Thermotomaculum hydrothermale]|uniref:Iron-sulfur cluster carrier protein n=1 Tax=Thermotomaculum hydrothermale TaxID=981385 RepID=A0A7R6SZR2_9BACT|nr:Mrp/NBP35 family ATP-binding protein [Thermotomaculum hydrothermale]BBB33002.1 ATP-binding protein involved in chromosome partitioning [Thermotomaculum hydrothermale]